MTILLEYKLQLKQRKKAIDVYQFIANKINVKAKHRDNKKYI